MIIAAGRKNVWDRSVLAELCLWNDAQPHDGPVNMAIDEWLWQEVRVPTLRVYRWCGHWMSIGYFSSHATLPPEREFVRRPTGGGVVDHRHDWTYTLCIPRGHELAEIPAPESYRLIHKALGEVLRDEGVACELVTRDAEAESDHCFVKAVVHDLVDPQGRKLAGAGQRRGRCGLLHQGSVQGGAAAQDRAERLAAALARQVKQVALAPDPGWLARRCAQLYANPLWNRKR